jgi:hypothetical protein
LFPTAEIFLTFDGLREEQHNRRHDYDEFIYQALWLADHKWGNVVPWLFDEHRHQSGMLRDVIDRINTTLMMYVEADTPLVVDEPTDFESISDFLLDGHSNVVRLHHEAVIPAEHKHLSPRLRQRVHPHIAVVPTPPRRLCRLLPAHPRIPFQRNAKCFIEDKMHGILDQAEAVDGHAGWLQHRVHIYDPGNGNMKRSYHIDGRAGEPKYDETQVF